MNCTACLEIPPENYPLPSEALPLSTLFESADAGCPRCVVIKDAIMKWTGMSGSEKFVLQLRLGDDINRDSKRGIEVDSGLHVTVWEPGKGEDSVAGFCLYTDHAESARHFNIPLLVSISPNPTASDYARQATQWLQGCIEHHSQRCPPVHQELPTRVIDVRGSEHSARLHETKAGERGQYVALSYCWGLSQTFTTTIATLEERTGGFLLEKLPASIRDAILLARGMSIPYIWVDSLCVIQDSAADWERESAHMCTVYTKATVTIAALDSPGSDTGLIVAGNRRLLLVDPEQRIFARRHRHGRPGNLLQSKTMFSNQLKRDILLSRGWCLQEILLSPRVLWMKESEMCWTCLCETACECRPDLSTDLISKPGGSELQHLMFGIQNLPRVDWDRTSRWWLLQWFNLVQIYTSRNLTRVTDRLPAIAGLAAWISDFIAAEYVFGLWHTDDIREQLLWFINAPAEKMQHYRAPQGHLERDYAPSWSWASVWGQITMPRKADDWAHISVPVQLDEELATFTPIESPASTPGTTTPISEAEVVSTTPPPLTAGTPPESPPGSPLSFASNESYMLHRGLNLKRYGSDLDPDRFVWKFESVSKKLRSANRFGPGTGTLTLRSILVSLECRAVSSPLAFYKSAHAFVLPQKGVAAKSTPPVVLFNPTDYRDSWAADTRSDYVDSPEWYSKTNVYFIFAEIGVLKSSGNVVDFRGLLLELLTPDSQTEHRKFRRLGYAHSTFDTSQDFTYDDDFIRADWEQWQELGRWETIDLV